MKNRISSSLVVLFALAAFLSCKKDNKGRLDTNVSPAGNLTAPLNNASLNLTPGGVSITFTWNTPAAPDGADLVLYEVVFDKSTGDFSKPVYKLLSDGSGVQAQATVPQDTLNKIASVAGIASSSTGSLKWTVMASKAAYTKLSTAVYTLQVTRPAGFAVPPSALYITGSATEGGTDLTKAIALKKTSQGVFELYTSLQPGTYQLVDGLKTSSTKYYIDANGVIQQGSSTTAVTAANAAYRLNLDFNVASSKVLAIQSVGLFVSAYNSELGQLKYIGNSTWEAVKVPVTFYQFSWGRDDRYKFALHTANGIEYWGSSLQNNNPPAGQPASYFYLWPVTNDQWNNTYKFPPAVDTHNVTVDLYFQAGAAYTHTATAVN
jgi:hypothetical protein